MDNWRMVKIGTTQTQRKLFYNLNKERQRLISQGFDPDTATLSKNLGVSEEVVIEMDQRLARQDMSLDPPLSEDGGATRMDFLPALIPGVEDSWPRARLPTSCTGTCGPSCPCCRTRSATSWNCACSRIRPCPCARSASATASPASACARSRPPAAEIKKQLSDNIDDFSQDWIEADE
jgi:RNA polymerase sigma-32 factor